MYGYYYWHKDFVMLQDSFWECRSHKDFIVFETGCHMMKPLKYLDSKSLSIRFNWWRVPYWAMILPLTLLSAFLIISKPRQPKAPRTLQT